MATKNFFDLLGDDENEDPSQVVVRTSFMPAELKRDAGTVKNLAAPSKKPDGTGEAVKDTQRVYSDRGRGCRSGVRGGRGGRFHQGDRGIARERVAYSERNYSVDPNLGQTRDVEGSVGARSLIVEKPVRTENGECRSYEGGRGGERGRASRGHGEIEDRTLTREYDRHSGNVRGNETEKGGGAGRGNRGTDVDSSLILGTVAGVKSEESAVVNEGAEPMLEVEVSIGEEDTADAIKMDDNEMTLEEYQKVLDEKRKALESEKASERKVEVDKAFEMMQLVDNKKREDAIFIKLGQDKEKVKRDAAEREEKSRKPVSINEFLKPVVGEKYYDSSFSRGRGGRVGRLDRRDNAGRGGRDSSRGRSGGGLFDGNSDLAGVASAPRIEDKAQFPTLGGK